MKLISLNVPYPYGKYLVEIQMKYLTREYDFDNRRRRMLEETQPGKAM